MSPRPSPDVLARNTHHPKLTATRLQLLIEIGRHGYLIVHQDDIPERRITDSTDYWAGVDVGWNQCRDHILGDN